MTTSTVEADPRQPEMADPAEAACGHRWTSAAACDAGSAHVCSRTSPEHRSHLCACQAVELRTATHLPLGSRQPASGTAAPDAAGNSSEGNPAGLVPAL